jgi:hypothetical protein
VAETDYATIDAVAKKIADEKQPFERLELTKEELLEMFFVWRAPPVVRTPARRGTPLTRIYIHARPCACLCPCLCACPC